METTSRSRVWRRPWWLSLLGLVPVAVLLASVGLDLTMLGILLSLAPLTLLVRWPVLGMGVTLAAISAAAWLTNDDSIVLVGYFCIAAALGWLAFSRPWRVSLPALVVSVLVVALMIFDLRGLSAATDGPLIMLLLVCTWLLANQAGGARRRSVLTRAQEQEQAIEAERLRIAREMHDLIAHSLGVIAIQAGVGARVIETQPAEARNALSAIESTSRETLAELRRTLTALRRADPEGAPAAPAPGLADVGRLVATARDAGVTVEVEKLGEVRELPADLELSAYRIVQESVTNVVRHAQTPRCLVRFTYSAVELQIEVMDDGRGTGSSSGSGYGLVGMRERVTLLGGIFLVGPRVEGGFQVSARIPVPQAAVKQAAVKMAP